MKVLLATPIYPPDIGGPAQYAVELPQKLAPNHEVIVIAYGDSTDTMETKFVSKNKPLLWRLWLFGRAIYQYGREADVIYAQNAVAAGLPAVIAGKLLKKPVVIKVVGDEAWERAFGSGKTKKLITDFLPNPDAGLKIKIIMAIQKFVLRRATAVTTPSKYLGELITKTYGLNPSKVHTNYNAAATQAADKTVSKQPLQIATAVRLVKWKNVAGIIEAVKILREDHPDIHLIIAGTGPEKTALEQLTKDLELESNVTFRGEISREETTKLFAESAATILNSNYEGLPFGVLMSFAVGTPVVATDIPGTNEVVLHEQTGLLIKPDQNNQLALAIKKILTDSTLREKIIAGGKSALSNKFSWESHTKKLIEILKIDN